MARDDPNASPVGRAALLITMAGSAFLLVLSVLYYLHGARLHAIELTVRQCAEQGNCDRAAIERIAARLSDDSAWPAYLDSGSHYTRGLLEDYFAQDGSLPRAEQMAARGRAISQFRKATADSPLRSRAWFALGNDYLLLGRFNDAQSAFSTLLDIEPYPPFHFEFLQLTLKYAVLWPPAFRERLAANLCDYLKASDWGGQHIRMAVEYGMASQVSGCLHNAWQQGVMRQAKEQVDASKR